MSFFNPNQPILCRKKLVWSPEDRQRMRCIDLKLSNKNPLSGIYTSIDQTFLIWGLISGIIFITAQFSPINWLYQAIIWSILTMVGIIAMIVLTFYWVKFQKLEWLIYLWGGLMLIGLFITDLAIFYGWGQVLINLCPIWLFLSAIGYLGTGLGLRSRALFLAAFIHGMAILFLPMVVSWQFLVTGLIMMSNLFLYSEKQWDRVLPRGDSTLIKKQCVILDSV